ncbi:MAG: hypothetical protein AAF533_10515 [Acidobacteriota bacterium]
MKRRLTTVAGLLALVLASSALHRARADELRVTAELDGLLPARLLPHRVDITAYARAGAAGAAVGWAPTQEKLAQYLHELSEHRAIASLEARTVRETTNPRGVEFALELQSAMQSVSVTVARLPSARYPPRTRRRLPRPALNDEELLQRLLDAGEAQVLIETTTELAESGRLDLKATDEVSRTAIGLGLQARFGRRGWMLESVLELNGQVLDPMLDLENTSSSSYIPMPDSEHALLFLVDLHDDE